jgi:hypothetical protein
VKRDKEFFSHKAQAAWALLPGTLGPKSVCALTNARAESALKAGIAMADVSVTETSEVFSFGRGPLQLTDIIVKPTSTSRIRFLLFFLTDFHGFNTDFHRYFVLS